MRTFHRCFALHPLSACIAIAFPLWSAAAHAQPTFEASGAFVTGNDGSFGRSVPKAGAFTLPATSGSASGAAHGAATSYLDTSATVRAAATGDGHFGGSVITQELYGATAPMTSNLQFVYRDLLTNTSAVASAADFSLDIASLAFGFDFGSRYGTNRVTFAAYLYVDGTTAPLWSSTFSYDDGMASSGSGAYTASGADIGLGAALPATCAQFSGPSTDCAFFSGGFGIKNYQTTVALGSVAAGQTIGIHYEVDLSTETNMYGGGASIQFNDPSQLSSSGPAAGRLAFADAVGQGSDPGHDGGTMTAVPEPETYALMAAGLGLLAVARRRRGR